MKRLFALFFAISYWMSSAALAAGTTPLSLVQQFDATGSHLSGCLLYFFVAGTVATPQNAFADFGLTTPLPNPVACDQSGRVPQHWLADGLIHIRLTDSSGGVQVDTTMQVLGPSSGGGGGGGTVDPTTVFQTGAIMPFYGTGPRSGFVRLNGLTIGNATCGCTERANADTQNLFVYLYTTDPNLAVSGGRTGNALNDFNASKQLTLPDWRGRAIAALDDMGNSPAGRLTTTYFGTSATVLGAAGGSQVHSVSVAEMPQHNHAMYLRDPGHIHGGVLAISGVQANAPPGGSTVSGTTNTASATTGITIGSVPGVANDNLTSVNGGSVPMSIASPMMLATIYIKL